MNDKIVNISFNVWANSEEEGALLHKSVCEFIVGRYDEVVGAKNV